MSPNPKQTRLAAAATAVSGTTRGVAEPIAPPYTRSRDVGRAPMSGVEEAAARPPEQAALGGLGGDQAPVLRELAGIRGDIREIRGDIRDIRGEARADRKEAAAARETDRKEAAAACEADRQEAAAARETDRKWAEEKFQGIDEKFQHLLDAIGDLAVSLAALRERSSWTRRLAWGAAGALLLAAGAFGKPIAAWLITALLES